MESLPLVPLKSALKYTFYIVGVFLVCGLLQVSAITIGDLVQTTTSPVLVRSITGGVANPTATGTITAVGTQGTVVGGPQSATLSGTMHTWWQVSWDNGYYGWSVAEVLATVQSGASAPSITSVSPSPMPPLNGNQTLNIYGNYFQNGATLAFVPPEGGTILSTANKLTFISSTQISYQINNLSDFGAWTVKVNNPDGQTSGTASFTVGPVVASAPSITSVSPSAMPPLNGNQTLIIHGNNFQNGATLTFVPPEGGTIPSAASKLTFISSTDLSYLINNLSDSGTWTVRVNNPDGQSSDTASFTVPVVASSPSIASVSPTSMPPLNGNQTLIINGNNFQNGATLTFVPPEGGTIFSTATKLTFISSAQISYQINNLGDSGTWTVRVNNPDGQSTGTTSFTVSPTGGGGTIRLGVDYAFQPWPSPSGLKSAGYDFVIRYVGGSSSKDISASEAQALQAAGLDIILIYEDTADRMLSGYNAGVSDANTALMQATAAGAPQDFFCYFACDIDAQPSDQTVINAYLDGAASVLGVSRVGFYGGYGPVTRVLDAGKAGKAWQTFAWSSGNRDSRISLYQSQNEVTIAGGICDINEGYGDDIGQWRASAVSRFAVVVQANPSNGGTVTGGGRYAVGSQQQISATPAASWTFEGWSDGNLQNPRTITVPANGATYTATFTPQPSIKPAILAVTISGTTLRIEMNGTSQANYVLQGSIDLITWGDVQTVTMGADGTAQGISTTFGAPLKFFRVIHRQY